MSKSMILKAIFAIAVLGGAVFIIIKDEPATPTGDIQSIQPLPEQDEP